MKTRNICLLILVASFSTLTGAAQTADEIISKYHDAIGGKEKLSQIKTVRMENNMSVMGNDAPNVITIVNGKAYRSESELMGSQMVQVFTDKGGWMINPMAGATGAQKIPDEQFKFSQQQIFANPLLDYATNGYKAELIGKEKLGSTDAFKIKMTDKNNISTEHYFDASSFYLLQSVSTADMMGQQTQITMKFSNYKKTEFGWSVPHAIEIDFGGQFSLTTSLKSIAINKEVDMKIFEMPGN